MTRFPVNIGVAGYWYPLYDAFQLFYGYMIQNAMVYNTNLYHYHTRLCAVLGGRLGGPSRPTREPSTRLTFCRNTDGSLGQCRHVALPGPTDPCDYGCSISPEECNMKYPHFLYQCSSAEFCGCCGCWVRSVWDTNIVTIPCDQCDEIIIDTSTTTTQSTRPLRVWQHL